MYRTVMCLAFVCMLSAASVAPAALVGWWTLDEGTGTVVTDSSGNAINGTFVGTPTWVAGLQDGALQFDGTSASVDFGNPPKTVITGPLSVACWINAAVAAGQRSFLARYRSYVFKGNGANLRFTTPGVRDHNATKSPITVGEWQHVAVTFQPSTPGGCIFYIGGVETERLDASAYNAVAATATGPFLMGSNEWNERYSGLLDDVRLYDNVLTPAEVKQLAARPKAHTPNPANNALAVVTPLLQWKAGTSALFHNVYFGTTPDLTEANLVGTRQSFPMYYHMAGLEPGVTYYWRVDEIEADLTTIHTGDVWSFVAQATTAYHPSPADGAVDADVAPTLTWLPGLTTVKHHVYFGSSLDAVTQGTAETDKGEVPAATFAPGDLEPVTTYYWRVDETVAGGEVKAGPVWSFTTVLPVDDFESYTDDEGGRIYETWIDGWTNGTGSQVGNVQAPFAERTIIHGGAQSMPVDYNNANSPFLSEAERTFATAQDWTFGGVDSLVLFVRGSGTNAAALVYVTLQDSAGKQTTVSYADDTAAKSGKWIEWKIPLSDFTGVNPARIKKMVIGVGNKADPKAGGAGRIYIDDIRVMKPAAVPAQ